MVRWKQQHQMNTMTNLNKRKRNVSLQELKANSTITKIKWPDFACLCAPSFSNENASIIHPIQHIQNITQLLCQNQSIAPSCENEIS